MALLKKFIMAFLISVAMFATAPSVMAAEGGPKETLADVIKYNIETIEAMKNGDDRDSVLALLKKTKQTSKSIVISGPADLPRSKANIKIKKSRKAYRKDDMEAALSFAEEALELYKKAKNKHFK